MVQSGAITLNEIERTELTRHEQIIERGINTFVEVGQALVSIRDKRLYRAEYQTFDEYCRERWGIHRSRAYQLIDAARIVGNLSTSVDIGPTTEYEIRPLRTLPPDQQREAWERAIETAPDGKVTAGHVQRVVDEMTGRVRESKELPPEANKHHDAKRPNYSLPPTPQESPEAHTPRSLDVHFSSATPEHYTPQIIIDAVLDCMEVIDLDPCSNSADSPNVPAQKHYTKSDDGLAREWHGRIYMNPPYGRDINTWVEKLIDEYDAGRVTEAIALVPSRTDTKWWGHFADFPVCFLRGRLKFGDMKDGAPFPSAIFYMGPNIGEFYYAFKDIGEIRPSHMQPWMFGT